MVELIQANQHFFDSVKTEKQLAEALPGLSEESMTVYHQVQDFILSKIPENQYVTYEIDLGNGKRRIHGTSVYPDSYPISLITKTIRRYTETTDPSTKEDFSRYEPKAAKLDPQLFTPEIFDNAEKLIRIFSDNVKRKIEEEWQVVGSELRNSDLGLFYQTYFLYYFRQDLIASSNDLGLTEEQISQAISAMNEQALNDSSEIGERFFPDVNLDGIYEINVPFGIALKEICLAFADEQNEGTKPE